MSEQEISYLQPGDVIVTKKWISDECEVSETLKTYFKSVCMSLVGDIEETKLIALQEVETNCQIGEIIDWFYNFAYFLLSHHSSCEQLTVCAFSLIESLDANPITDLSVSEKQVAKNKTLSITFLYLNFIF